MSQFSLRFDPADIPLWASRYHGTPAEMQIEKRIEQEIAPRIHQIGFYTRPDFLVLTRWKTPRAQPRCEENSAALIEETTGLALSARDERLRIGVLMLLNGVSWPTASVLLHFGSREPYPILDFRALWSLGVEDGSVYSFPFWRRYVEECRRLAEENGVSMRTLDRALWQYSKEHQRRGIPVEIVEYAQFGDKAESINS